MVVQPTMNNQPPEDSSNTQVFALSRNQPSTDAGNNTSREPILVDDNILELLEKVLPGNGIAFASQLFNQAVYGKDIPAELSEYANQDFVVIHFESIRTLAQRIKCGYDTTHKYIVTFQALNLLHKYRCQGKTYWIFPTYGYEPPPTLEMLDRLIAESRPKVRNFARNVRERYVIYCATISTQPEYTPASPEQQDIPTNENILANMGSTLYAIQTTLCAQGLDGQKGLEIALKVTAEAIAQVKHALHPAEPIQKRYYAPSEHSYAPQVPQEPYYPSQECYHVSQAFQEPYCDLPQDDVPQEECILEELEFSAFPHDEPGPVSPIMPANDSQPAIPQDDTPGELDTPVTHPYPQHGAEVVSQESISPAQLDVEQARPQEDFSGKQSRPPATFYREQGDSSSPVPTSGGDFSPIQEDFVSPSQPDDFSAKQGDYQPAWEDFFADHARKNWEWDENVQDAKARVRMENVNSRARVKDKIPMNVFSPTFRSNYVTLGIKDLFKNIYTDVTLRRELYTFLAMVFEDQSKEGCYSNLEKENCDIRTIFASFVYILACMFKPGGSTIKKPGGLFLKTCYTRSGLTKKVQQFVRDHGHLTYEQLIATFKAYSVNQEKREDEAEYGENAIFLELAAKQEQERQQQQAEQIRQGTYTPVPLPDHVTPKTYRKNSILLRKEAELQKQQEKQKKQLEKSENIPVEQTPETVEKNPVEQLPEVISEKEQENTTKSKTTKEDAMKFVEQLRNEGKARKQQKGRKNSEFVNEFAEERKRWQQERERENNEALKKHEHWQQERERENKKFLETRERWRQQKEREKLEEQEG